MKALSALNRASLLSSLLSVPLSLAMLAGSACAAEGAASAPAKPDLAKGQAISTQVCASCHTNDGSRGSPAYPILQGQHEAYLVKQLTEFKNGKRKNPIMTGMAAALSDADMRNVAAFYASKSAKPGFAKNKADVAMAEKIYRGGITEKKVPACAACHSPDGAGIPSQFPRIGGQQADYTAAQLTAFRNHTRNNNPIMTTVAANLSDDEIKALADYIAGLH